MITEAQTMNGLRRPILSESLPLTAAEMTVPKSRTTAIWATTALEVAVTSTQGTTGSGHSSPVPVSMTAARTAWTGSGSTSETALTTADT